MGGPHGWLDGNPPPPAPATHLMSHKSVSGLEPELMLCDQRSEGPKALSRPASGLATRQLSTLPLE